MKNIICCFFLLFSFSVAFGQMQNSNSSYENFNKKNNLSSINKLSQSSVSSNSVTEVVVDPQIAMSMPDYPVTAGDVYSLMFAVGSNPIAYTITVDSTYKIRVANLGVISCKGLTFNQLKNQIDTLVSKNYPMSGVQFVLIHPAVFLVSITGEVIQAAERKAWALTRLSSFISESVTPYSSTRKVSIISADGSEKTFDLFTAQRNGNFEQDPYLRPGDKIVVQRYERKVTINGAVERPGKYELLENENLKELINVYANGASESADLSRTQILRIDGKGNNGEVLYLSKKEVEENAELLNYDVVTVASYKDIKPAVFMEGAVTDTSTDENLNGTKLQTSSRVVIHFFEGENYANLIRRNSLMFLPEADLKNAYILRENSAISIDLSQILYDVDFYSSQYVKKNDVLVVPFRQLFVMVSGAVMNPGRFSYIPDRNWDYYVGLAGGIDSSRNSRKKMKIMTLDGKTLGKEEFIQPETMITVEENSAWYKWNKIAPTVTTMLTIVSTMLSIIVVSNSL